MPVWNVAFDVRVEVNSPEMVSNIAQIHALAGVIRGIPIPPSVQRNLDRLNIMRAVQVSWRRPRRESSAVTGLRSGSTLAVAAPVMGHRAWFAE